METHMTIYNIRLDKHTVSVVLAPNAQPPNRASDFPITLLLPADEQRRTGQLIQIFVPFLNPSNQITAAVDDANNLTGVWMEPFPNP